MAKKNLKTIRLPEESEPDREAFVITFTVGVRAKITEKVGWRIHEAMWDILNASGFEMFESQWHTEPD